MPQTIRDSSSSAPRLLPENASGQAKAILRKSEKADNWHLMGEAIERIRAAERLSLKEFAAAIERDERQIARWVLAQERPQIEAVFAVPKFRQSLVLALAELSGIGVEVSTHITLRRSA